MSRLSSLAVITGSLMALMFVPCVFVPDQARQCFARFPRNRLAGWMLLAIDLVWTGWLVFNMSLGQFDKYKPLLFAIVPAAFVLIVVLMDDLLAPRALGGIFLLVPTPMLDAAFCHESGLRLVIVVLAYVIVVAGIALVLSPYLFRKATNAWSRDRRVCKIVGMTGLVAGVLVVLLGMTVY